MSAAFCAGCAAVFGSRYWLAAAGCDATVMPDGCLMQAAKCAGVFSSSGGTVRVQSASLSGCWHLG
jgi:hypothetical protein